LSKVSSSAIFSIAGSSEGGKHWRLGNIAAIALTFLAPFFLVIKRPFLMRGFDIVYIYNFTIFTNCQRTNIRTWKVLERRSENAALPHRTEWRNGIIFALLRIRGRAKRRSGTQLIFSVYGGNRVDASKL